MTFHFKPTDVQPEYRAYHFISDKVYDVANLMWHPETNELSLIAVDGQESGVRGPLSDFMLIAKSIFKDYDGNDVWCGDLVKFPDDSKYSGEIFVVSSVEDGICVSKEGIHIPVCIAMGSYQGIVVGSVFKNRDLYLRHLGESEAATI